MPVTPGRGHTFRLRDRALDRGSGDASFTYELDGDVFEERVVVPAGDATPSDGALDVLLDVCHVAVGTSYFKLSAPRRLVFDRPTTSAVVDLARQSYDEGLREFAFVNALPLPLGTEIVAEVGAPPSSGPPPGCTNPLLPIGGGKDSAAVLTLLPHATGVAVSPTAVQRRLTGAAGVELLEVTRTLDPRLAELTAAGGLNGHIPVTAINSALSVLVAALGGYDSVMMGNERSASEPTRTVAGVAVNHQHSKSFDFERAVAHAVAPAGIRYVSLLRQLSELSIAGIVAGNDALWGDFLSCNRAFKRSRGPDEPQKWCLECAKCLFTFLCFAPFLSPEDAEAVFGGNPLREPALAAGFRRLWDVDFKPFDCVGERVESAVAMAWLATADGWAAMPVVEALGDEAADTAKDLDTTIDDVLRPDGPHLLPDDLASLVAERATAVRPRQ